MNYRRRKKNDENIMFLNLNDPPIFKDIKTLMLKYHEENIAEIKAQELFQHRAIYWIDIYSRIIDKEDEVHFNLLSKYIFFFISQSNSNTILKDFEDILFKRGFDLNEIIYKELFDWN